MESKPLFRILSVFSLLMSYLRVGYMQGISGVYPGLGFRFYGDTTEILLRFMREETESRIYVVPELSTDNERWINPDFGTPELRTHYDNIKRMVKEKTGGATQEKERERKGKNGKIIKVTGCSPIREGVLLIRPGTTLADVVNSVKNAKDARVLLR